MSDPTPSSIIKTTRTSEGLRNTLFDALDASLNKQMQPAEAQAICKICAQIINSVNTEIEFYKHIASKLPDGTAPNTVLQLGGAGK
ncbi:MAG: hypothetical protein V4458_06125 [Pseudomonadota bacterium]